MLKKFLSLILITFGFTAQSQIYMAEKCTVTFFSDAPLEKIEAKNTAARPIINTADNKVAVKVPIKGFVFEKPLMQEHFNENYMESDKFPSAVFTGKINESVDWTKEGKTKVTCTGTMEIHGVKKNITIPGDLTIAKDRIDLLSTFDVKVADYNIEIPKLVFQNIAETVRVTLNTTLVPFKKK